MNSALLRRMLIAGTVLATAALIGWDQAPEHRVPAVAAAVKAAYVGALGADASKEQVFLSSGDRLLIVSLGDVIDGQYRLDAITATGATFTYLPLNVKQVMSTQGEGK